MNNLASLVSLTELNLRRNNIEYVTGLNQLPALQRVFLSHNAISRLDDIRCLFDINFLIELSLDGNPISETEPARYRSQLILGMPGLRHLDLKRVTDDERASAAAVDHDAQQQPQQACQLIYVFHWGWSSDVPVFFILFVLFIDCCLID